MMTSTGRALAKRHMIAISPADSRRGTLPRVRDAAGITDTASRYSFHMLDGLGVRSRSPSVQIHQQPHFGDAIQVPIQLGSQNRRAAAKLMELDLPRQNGVPASMTLAIRRERTTDGFVVRLIGDLDARMVGTVTQAITATPESAVVVDLSDLNSLDDEGLRGLVEAGDHLTCDGRALSVVGARGDVMTAIRSSDLMGFT